jgi:hypothetical protein
MAGQPRSLDPEELKDAFKRAAEIAAVVPPAMQDAAFNRALDQILRGGERVRQTKSASRGLGRAKAEDEAESGGAAEQLIDGINRTVYPEIAEATKVLDRALAVLRLASRDFNIDGLTASETAKVLTDKFRERTSHQAVRQALAAAHTMVDTGKRGRVTVYRIMQRGEDYLDAGGSRAESGIARPTPTRQRSRRKVSKPRKKASVKTEGANDASLKPAARASRRRGPKTALGELIDEGFFSHARTINDAQEQLRHKKGQKFTLQDLSPSLVRLLREGRLDRDRNASGQYEYRSK